MIRSFRNKRLKRLFENDDARGLPPDQVDRINRRLDTINAARTIEECNVAGYPLHALSGDYKGFHAVWVTGNWRIVFRFVEGDAFDVDHVDYHQEDRTMSLKHPIHPGRIVRDDCLPELNLTVGAASRALGVSRQTLDKIINGRGSVTPDMAIRFEKVFGSSADMWLRLQTAYDLAQAREREAEIVATVRAPARPPQPKHPALT